jgi:uncharacterized membrane protein YphA (DoxX/SURF4 family)
MNQRSAEISIVVLRWTLGLIVLWESLLFIFAPGSIHHFAKTGLPQWIRPTLGGVEIIAAILFLLPWTDAVGSRLLLFVFAVAALIHVLHGDFDISGLVLYAVVVIVCMTHRNTQIAEAPRESPH